MWTDPDQSCVCGLSDDVFKLVEWFTSQPNLVRKLEFKWVISVSIQKYRHSKLLAPAGLVVVRASLERATVA